MGYSSTELVFSLPLVYARSVAAQWHIVGTPETFVKVREENKKGEKEGQREKVRGVDIFIFCRGKMYFNGKLCIV